VTEPKLKYLFQPIKIGRMEIKNRILMSPMGLINVAEMPGTFYEMDENEAYLYAERAAGGVGMILNGGAAVNKLGHSDPGLLCLYDERIIPSLKRTVDMVHATAPDCRFGVQLLHGGCQSLFPVEAPSPVSALAMQFIPDQPPPKELTKERILEIEEEFGVAAARAKEAGCDFVEIHGAHGYLVGEFYSPIFNHRTDEYGGSFENRIKFYVEVLHSIKRHVGADFPVGCRINGDDYIDGGWTLQDACKLAPILEREGADYIHVSFGIYGSTGRSGLPGTGLSIAPMYDKPGTYILLAEEVKKHVSIPVVGGCRMKDPILADEVIRDGKVDLVYMGRPLLADPELPNKAREGRIGEIKTCQGCCWCIEAVMKGASLTCVMNPRLSREMALKDVEGECAANPKKVLVVGGGPAGMEAARLTAFRGHKVILCESKGWLGGQLKLASMMPDREEFADHIAYYERELQRLAVPIRLNTTVDEALIDEIKPDVVIVATGSLPEVPYIPGLLDSGVDVVTVDDLIETQSPTGDNVLVIGGDADGLQCAHYLALHGRKVWVAHPGAHYAERMGSHNRYPLRAALTKLGVSLYKDVSLPETTITAEGVKIVHKKGTETLPKIDTVVLAGERSKNAYVAEITKRKGIETHIVGDAHMLYEDPLAGSVLMATQSANICAREIK